MMKKNEKEILQMLEEINWDFVDYNSAKYPLDLNSIPWYPATFPAPIPKYLIALLSEPKDIVFDPFGGKGTTAVETLKQRRKFIYNDLNPHAVLIMRCLLSAMIQAREDSDFLKIVEYDQVELSKNEETGDYSAYKGKDEYIVIKRLPINILSQLNSRGIKQDVIYWYHSVTLIELIRLFDHINQFEGADQGIRKLAFISILKDVSSQRGHFSYVTDNCRPSEMKYYNAIDSYLEMLDRIQRSCQDFVRQYVVINKQNDIKAISQKCIIHSGDAKDCSYLSDESVDLIITSPPYLCAQDYIFTMRLNDFFFPDEGFENLPIKEIGPRRLRKRQGIVNSYFDDLTVVMEELYRVLRKDAYLCLIIGQGKGKVYEGIDIIANILNRVKSVGFSQIYRKTRNISYRTNRIGGVDKEDLILFRK